MNPIHRPKTRFACLLANLSHRLGIFDLCLATLLLAGNLHAAEPLRVMSFNIRFGTANDGEDSWPNRKALLFDVIKTDAPDYIGVQEAIEFQLSEITTAIPDYASLGVGRDDGAKRGEYSAILYRKSRLSPVKSGTFWLSDTPDVPGSKSWGNNITRVCTWADFEDLAQKKSGEPPFRFRAYNTHWDHESQPARLNSGRLLARRIADEAGADIPVIVTGDFNSGEKNPAFLELLGGPAGLFDSFRRLHPDAAGVGTFHGFKGGADREKIDAILLSRHWRPLSAEIIRTSRAGRFPSDHYPVTAEIAANPPAK